MSRLRIVMGRVSILLALIVQIMAPALSNTSMVRMAVDPLAEAFLCAHDGPISGRNDAGHPAHGAACDFCQLATAGGYAPPPIGAVLVLPAATAGHADWRITVEAVVGPRLLDHIRGRAPPILA